MLDKEKFENIATTLAHKVDEQPHVHDHVQVTLPNFCKCTGDMVAAASPVRSVRDPEGRDLMVYGFTWECRKCGERSDKAYEFSALR